MAKTLIAFFSRADENYFGGTMKYIEMGNTEVVAGKIKDRIDADVKKGLPLNGSGVNRADGQIESWLKSNGLM